MTKCRYCNKIASFGRKGKMPRYCFTHKKPHHINLRRRSCSIEGCDKHPRYNYPEQYALYCRDHKKKDMVSYPYSRPPLITCLMCSRKLKYTEKRCDSCAERLLSELNEKIQKDRAKLESELIDLYSTVEERL